VVAERTDRTVWRKGDAALPAAGNRAEARAVAYLTMKGIRIGFRWLGGALRAALVDPESQAIGILLALMLSIATTFYIMVEGWSWIDALHYSTMILTTIGEQRVSPTTTGSKLFTVVFAVVGVGLLLVFVSRVATLMLRHRDK